MPQMPQQAIKYSASGFTSLGGGPAATAAVAIGKLGGEVALAARVGSDSLADFIVEELTDYGVNCDLVTRFDEVSSSVSSVILDDSGERLIVNYIDPNLPSDPNWLPRTLEPNVKAVLADTRWPQGAEYMLSIARGAGIPAILDADKPIPKDGAILRAATHLAFSADGLADYVGHQDYETALSQIADETGAWCCVTLGEKGVFYITNADRGYVPGFKVKAVDTLGAGDVWHGAFAYAIAQQQTELEAIRYASAAAAIKVQRIGGRSGAPTSAELAQFLTEN